MNATRVVVLPATAEPRPVHRGEARDGWRVFRSKQLTYEIAIPAYQLARVQAIARMERAEWYALVVGEVMSDPEGTHVVVRDLVPNEWAERGKAFVKIPALAEARVRELARTLHPTLRPIGNIHSHPGYSVNPSRTDCLEFWSDGHCVSIIIDPFGTPNVAVYRGPEGELLEEVVGGPEVDVPADAAATIGAPSEPNARVTDKPTVTGVVSALILLACVIWMYDTAARNFSEIGTSLASISRHIAALDQKSKWITPIVVPATAEEPLMCMPDDE